MLLEILVDFVLWVVSFFGYIFPQVSVPPDVVSSMDSIMNFIVQGAGIVKFVFGPAITWLANLGVLLISARAVFNLFYLVFRWIPFIDVGGD